MEDIHFLNYFEQFSDNSNIANNISIQGEINYCNFFTKRLLELGFGYVVTKSIKYEDNLLK